jgi:hypothetical protein
MSQQLLELELAVQDDANRASVSCVIHHLRKNRQLLEVKYSAGF